MSSSGEFGSVRVPAGFADDLWERYGATVERLADELQLYEFHHLGFWVDKPHPQAVKTPWGVHVGPAEQGVELLYSETEPSAATTRSNPHYCFAVQEIEPHLQGRTVTKEPFIGPLGWAAFVEIDGLSVEFLIPDPSPWYAEHGTGS